MDGNNARRGYFTPTTADLAVLVASWAVLVLTFPISLIFCIKIVKEYDRMIIFRLGRVWSPVPKGPGIVLVMPFIDEHTIVDLRTMSYNVPTQEMLTRDSVMIAVDAAVYYRTSDPIASISMVNDAHTSTRQLAQSTLRNVLGTRSLSEILLDRQGIAAHAKSMLDKATLFWGIHVERVEIKDIRIPNELCRAMAAEAEAQRQSDAKVVTAHGELTASMALRRAADELVGSPAAIQLRHVYLLSLAKISARDNHTIVIPFPIDFMKRFIK
ncbi:unnamed protein product [Caenorhabditis auriculariae]|uniref:Band 7 domain-containing protein n=1 Tax=Caenorhabditis auriculariae TaxID=2777116 RepID=A0A8S1GPS8_9PELO|nr:unnamed protein product [Caenorhabditis auriculariae]